MRPSQTQLAIAKSLQDGINVRMESVSGAGKTTTAMIASEALMKDKLTILMLTYNRKLMNETWSKCSHIPGFNVYTFHAFCGRFYHTTDFTDNGISESFNLPPLRPINFDVLILDEVQDMTPLYYKLVCRMWHDNTSDNPKRRIMIMGDAKQCIYQFNGSDPRFMTMGHRIFDFDRIGFHNFNMNTTFRLPKAPVRLINQAIEKKEDFMVSAQDREGHKPLYVYYNPFDQRSEVVQLIEVLLGFKRMEDTNLKGSEETDLPIVNPEDIMIVVPSTSSPAASMIENSLKRFYPHLPIYVSNAKEESVDELVTTYKKTIITFCQSKGLERKVVIILHFDSSYFAFYNRDDPPNIPTNDLYVSLTRGSELVVMCNDRRWQSLPFVDMDCIRRNNLAVFFGTPPSETVMEQKNMDPLRSPPHKSVSRFIRYTNSSVMMQLLNSFEFVQNRERGVNLTLPSVSTHAHEDWMRYRVNPSETRQNIYLKESVADINGIALPMYTMYRWSMIYDPDAWTYMLEDIMARVTSYRGRISKRTINEKLEYYMKCCVRLKFSDMLWISHTQHLVQNSKYVSGYQQVNSYNWCHDQDVEKIYRRYCDSVLQSDVSSPREYEMSLSCPFVTYDKSLQPQEITLEGRVDMILQSKGTPRMYEFKCTDLSAESKVQLIFYAYIWLKNGNPNIRYILYSLYSDEEQELIVRDPNQWLLIAEEAFRQMDIARYSNLISDENDNEFLQKCLEIQRSVGMEAPSVGMVAPSVGMEAS